MHSYPPFKPGQLILAIAIGFVIVLGSLVHSAWAAPGQQPERQSVPTSAYTPTPTEKPKQEKSPTATPVPPATPTAAPLLPKSGGLVAQPQQADYQQNMPSQITTMTLLGSGLALLGIGLWFRTRQRHANRSGPGVRR